LGTGLVRFTAGKYELTFHQAVGTRLEGRVAGAPPELCVAVAQPGGELIAVDARRRELVRVVELGATGAFALELVPAGELELRVGTREELSAGRWRHRERFTSAGETVRIEIEL
jgi:hypothetical protein